MERFDERGQPSRERFEASKARGGVVPVFAENRTGGLRDGYTCGEQMAHVTAEREVALVRESCSEYLAFRTCAIS